MSISETNKNSKKALLIDGHSIINRAFYGLPDLTNSNGEHTNAIYGFLNIMFKIMDEEKPNYLVVAFDLKDKTFRHQMFDAYKGTRKGMPVELTSQVPVLQDLLNAMNICVCTKQGFEADDILGTLAKAYEKAGADVSILSGDRDLLQLATEKIKIRIPKTKKGVTTVEDYNAGDVVDLYGVTPTEFIDLKALMGDASDNIPGVAGIGEKTASKIIIDYHTIENAYANYQSIEPKKAGEKLYNDYSNAVLSKKLATIEINAPLDINLESAMINNIFNENAYSIIKRLELKTILKKFSESISETKDERKLSDLSVTSIKNIEELSKINLILLKAESFALSYIYFQSKASNEQLTFDFFNTNEQSTSFISLAISVNDSIYTITSKELQSDTIIDFIEALNIYDGKILVANKKQFLKDFKASYKYIYDLSVASYLLNPIIDNYSYDEIAKDYLNSEITSRDEIIGKKDLYELYSNDNDTLLKPCIFEAYVLNKASNTILEKLANNNMLELYTNIELPLIDVLNSMEEYGVMVNRSELKNYSVKLKAAIDELTQKIYASIGHEFNINSPKQLGEILFEELNLPYGKKTKTGYSTSADILEKLSVDYPFVRDILEYRQLSKLKSTYTDGLDVFIKDDNRIHCNFKQTITATGRISCTDPNLQNIPIRMDIGKEIRKAFIPEDGFVFVDADYSQIELRVLASLSSDEALIEAYKQAKDIHQITASKVFHIPLEDVTAEQRRNAKAVNFGIVYGISSFGLSQDLSISKKEAATYIDEYFKSYPNIKQYLENVVAFAKENGFSVTMFNRKRPIPELSSSNFMQRSFGERIAMNSPIQGTAADIIKIAMINVNNALLKRKLKSRLILQVHDELLIEAAIDEVDEVKAILSKEMTSCVNLAVNLETDINIGNNWLEAH